MGRARTIARRSFLIGSAAIVGGVAFGTYLIKRPIDNPLLADLTDGEATFYAWVKIDADTITLIGPHADKGQGAVSSQAALIADEMDLDFGQFETALGCQATRIGTLRLQKKARRLWQLTKGLWLRLCALHWAVF